MRPTERTLKWLRKLGYTAEVVERRLPHSFVMRDLFGCLDIVAIQPSHMGVLGVQTTTSAHLQDRVKKVRAEPRAALWLACENLLWVVAWGQKGPAGTRKLWVPTVINITEGGSSILSPGATA